MESVGALVGTLPFDAHILAAIGKGYTRFPGRTAETLRCAVLHGRTVAWSGRYRACDLVGYARFWLGPSLERGQPAWLSLTGSFGPDYSRGDGSAVEAPRLRSGC